MNQKNTTDKLVKASVHLFFETIDEAKREAYVTGCPYFRSYINGVEMYSVRVKLPVS